MTEGTAAGTGWPAAVPVTVELTPCEVWTAVVFGANRHVRHFERERQHRDGAGEEGGWGRDMLAVAAELAVAKALDRYWADAPDPDHDGDVGSRDPKVHVRHSTRLDGRLILRPRDPDDAPFVLVVGSIPVLVVAGWITAREGKAGEPDDAGNGRMPCWWVPQSALRPIEELRR